MIPSLHLPMKPISLVYPNKAEPSSPGAPNATCNIYMTLRRIGLHAIS